MPMSLAFLLFSGPLGGIFSFATLLSASQTIIGLGLSLGLSFASKLFQKKPDLPDPEDGKFNLRQTVPSRTVVLGRAKKGGDYIFLEEYNGVAYHVMSPASHRINGVVQHYLHDEAVTLNGSDFVTSPTHFGTTNVKILTRLGLAAETAYSNVISAFPTIWGLDYRGDGLASWMMSVGSVSQENHQTVYPQGMPQHSAEIEGALLYDPREITHDLEDDHDCPTTWEYSENIALMRLWHLTHRSGAKLTFDDMHFPDWIAAADTCDETVLNRAGDPESRYHGGIWYRYENNPVDVGRTLDEAAELVLYETADGKVGVHSGRYVGGDIRITEDDILSLVYDANLRQATTVLAVRGRFTDPSKQYNTVDAAIFGDPYVSDESERTKTLANVAVQSHNHIQRLQKIAKTRANAPRVQLVVHYEVAKHVRFRRFITVHLPPRLDEATIEIINRPKLSLQNLTWDIEGIVVSSTLYDFDAATEEGVAGSEVTILTPGAVPVPAGFDVTIERESVVGGASGAYGLGTWTAQSAALLVEIEWQPTAGGPIERVRAAAGDTELRTTYLADGVEYKFRARNWSGGAQSDWTSYVTRTAVADTTAPGDLASVSTSGNLLGGVTLNFTTPASANLRFVKIYRAPNGVTLNKVTHLIETIPVLISTTYGRNQGDVTRTNLIVNGDFASGSGWTTDVDWTIAAGVASHVSGGAASVISRVIGGLVGAATYRFKYVLSAVSAGDFRVRIDGATSPTGLVRTANGTFYEGLAAPASPTGFSFRASATGVGSVDDIVMYEQTGSCLAQGTYDIYVEPLNGSLVAGTLAGPFTVTII